MLQLFLDELVLHVVEYALVQIQNYLAIHRSNLILYSADFSLYSIQRLGIAIERLGLMLTVRQGPLFVVLWIVELRAQN